MTENLPDTNVGNIEYIRKNDASDWLKQYGQDVLHGKYKFSLMYIWKNIMDLPPADVAPVVHSQWKYKCGEIQCPECGNRIHRIDLSGCLNFCPNCGAKMDAQREE